MNISVKSLLMFALLFHAGPAIAGVLQARILEYGPEMPDPHNPEATVSMLLEATQPLILDEQIEAVEVVHAEETDINMFVDGKFKSVPEMQYLVRIRFNQEGYRELHSLYQKLARREKEANPGHEVRAELRIAEMWEGNRVFFDHDTKSAELRVVITQEQLVSLANVVQQDWKRTEEKSIFDLWSDGEVDRSRK